jgi:hypothetical protein
MTFDPDRMAALLNAAIRSYGLRDSRTLQSDAGIIGPSDLGFCRQKAALMTRGVAQTDSKPIWAAQMGTATHRYVGAALAETFPNWIIDNTRVVAEFPSGARVAGTPDIIDPDDNAVIDVKTVDGFEKIKRYGTSLNHRFQRHTYALGAVQAGLLDGFRPVIVGNLYLDRSGGEADGLLVWEEFDPLLTTEIDQWIEDVQYAVIHNEDASRDVAAPVCEKICEYFTACRGDLPVSENEVLDKPEIIEAVTLYVEGRDLEKRAKQMKSEAQATLSGLNGLVAGWQVRTTEVSESDIPGYTRAGYTKIDVRKARG